MKKASTVAEMMLALAPILILPLVDASKSASVSSSQSSGGEIGASTARQLKPCIIKKSSGEVNGIDRQQPNSSPKRLRTPKKQVQFVDPTTLEVFPSSSSCEMEFDDVLPKEISELLDEHLDIVFHPNDSTKRWLLENPALMAAINRDVLVAEQGKKQRATVEGVYRRALPPLPTAYDALDVLRLEDHCPGILRSLERRMGEWKNNGEVPTREENWMRKQPQCWRYRKALALLRTKHKRELRCRAMMAAMLSAQRDNREDGGYRNTALS